MLLHGIKSLKLTSGAEGEFKYNEAQINSLRQLSEKRQQKEKEFKYLEKNISWFKEKREQKTVSLSLNQRLKEKAIDSNKSKVLNDEFDALKILSFLHAKLSYR